MGEIAAPTPAEHVRELLARAQNPFDVADAVVGRLGSAVLCEVRPQSARGRDTPALPAGCSSYRHNFLLGDGSCLALWELRYTGPYDGRPLHEVYDTVEALIASRRRLQHRDAMGDAGNAGEAGAGEGMDDAGGGEGGERAGGAGEAVTSGGSGCARPDCCRCAGQKRTPEEAAPEAQLIAAAGPFGPTRRHVEPDSPDHARRLLRRAENDDSPGDDVRQLLDTALAHEILPGSRPRVRAPEWQVWCSMYEHAFLLADGSEMRLYELEHNLSRSGQLICEVYLEESVADQAAHRHARARELDS